MPAGFQLLGPDGSVWADSNLMPAGLIKSGFLGGGETVITVTGTAPVIFFRTTADYWVPPTVYPNHMVRVERVSVSGNSWQFVVSASRTTGVVLFYIFDPMVGSAGNFGLQVFNESGQPIFNSNNPPLRVTHFVRSADEYATGYLLYTKTAISGLPAFAAFSLSVYRRGFTSSETEQSYSDFYKTYCGLTSDGTGVYSYGAMIETALVSGPEGAWTNQSIPWITIADVSNCPVPFN